jgi:hypothetical protein
MQLGDELTEEQHQAIIACLRIAAARGRQLRLAREAQTRLEQAQPETPPIPETSSVTTQPVETAN